jgi:hypothetical protein
MTESQAEQQFGVDISSRRQLNELQRLQQTHGDKVNEWIDEGIPREALGRPDKMRAFRTPKKEATVPSNSETTDQQQIQQRAGAASDTCLIAKSEGYIQRMDHTQKPNLNHQRQMLHELVRSGRGLLESSHPTQNEEKLIALQSLLEFAR